MQFLANFVQQQQQLQQQQAGLSWGSVQAETVSLEPCLAHSYKLLIYKLALK